jgi:hypothetical protein
MKKKHLLARLSFLLPIALAQFLSPSAHASALWGVVPGRVLASAGEVSIVKEKADLWSIVLKPSKVSSPVEGTYLNTSQSGLGIFFGTIGNSVTISRSGQDGAGGAWTLGALNTGLKAAGGTGGIRDGKAWREDKWEYWVGRDGDGAKRNFRKKVCTNCHWQFYPAEGDQRPYAHGAVDGFRPIHKEVINFPSYMLAQNSVVTKVWECYPAPIKGYYPMFEGGTGAKWHAKPEPVINAVGNFTQDGQVTPVIWSMTGWWQGTVNVRGTDSGPVVSGRSYNNVTLVDAMEMWPCDMMSDFYSPGGDMSISSLSGSENVTIRWDSRYDCEGDSVPLGDGKDTPVRPVATPTPTPPPTPTPAPDKGAVFYWNASRAPGQVFNVVQDKNLLRAGSDVRNFDAVIAQLREAGIGAVESAMRAQGAMRYDTKPYQWRNTSATRWTSEWSWRSGRHNKYRTTRYHTLTTYYWHQEHFSVGNAVIMVDPDLGNKPIVLSTREWGTIMGAIQKAEAAAATAYKTLEQARADSENSKRQLDAALAKLEKDQSNLSKLQSNLQALQVQEVKLQDKVTQLERTQEDIKHALDVLKRQNPQDATAIAKAQALFDKNGADLNKAKGDLAVLRAAIQPVQETVAAAKAAVEASAKAVAARVEEHAKNQHQTNITQEQYDAAKRNADNPTVTLGGQTAALSKEAKEKGVAEAQATLDKAQADAAKVEESANKILNNYNALVDKAEAARVALETLTKGESQLEALIDDLFEKTGIHGAALDAVDDAKTAVSDAKAARDQAIRDESVSKETLTRAESTLASAQTVYNNAVEDFGADSSQAKEAKKSLDKATSDKNAAQTSVNTAGTRVTQTSTELDSAASRLNSAYQVVKETEAVKNEQFAKVELAQGGAVEAADALGRIELQLAKMEADVIKSIEQVNTARMALDEANSFLAEQKFWANNSTGSYTTSIAGVIGARTDNAVSRWQTQAYSFADGTIKTKSPVTISFDGVGDFLAGADNWRPEDSRVPVLSAMRSINLDTEGEKMWEWIGPTEGLLIWNPEGKRVFQPTGAEFFGNWTWGKKWTDGYKPLQALDKNKDGKLDGEELAGIWVWIDANSDGEVQLGEMVPLSEAGIDTLSVNYQTDNRGGMWIPEGASGPKGTFPTRDWWSVGGMSFEDYDALVDLLRETPSMWVWEPNTPTGEDQGGGLNFYASQDYGLIALSIPRKDVYAVKFAELIGAKDPQQAKTQLVFNVRGLGEGIFQWEADLGFGKLTTVLEQKDDNVIEGATKIVDYEDPDVQAATVWTGKRVSGPSLDQIADVAKITAEYNR